jgi:hypothetical protein
MADALTYQLKLIDGMSAPANKADKALAALQKQIKAEEQELAKLNKAQRNLNKGDVVDINTSKLLKQQISAKSNSLAALQQHMVQLGQAGSKDIKGAAVETEGLSAALGELAGPAAIAAGALAALGAAVAGFIIGGASLAIQARELKDDTIDALDAFLGSQQAAEDVYDKLGNIERDVAISQERATGLARELSAAGVTNADALTDAIKSIGQVSSVLGSGAGEKVQKIIEKAVQSGKFTVNAKQLAGTGVQVQKLYAEIAARTGKGVKQVEADLKAGKISAEVGVAALTKVLDTKFGAVAGKQVLDLGNQLQRFKDNISKLFEDVDTGPFLSALHDILDLFDTETVTGKGLHDTLTAIFDGVFKAAAAALPYVKTALKGVFIIALQVAIALKPIIKAIKDAFGGDSKSGVDSFASALSTVGEVLGTVIGWLAKLVTNTEFLQGVKYTFYGIAVVVGLLAAGVALLVAPLYALGAAFVYVLGLGAEFVGWALNAGSAIVNGLLDGVLGGGEAFGKAVAQVAMKGLASFKAVFGIHSPSKVMAQMGKHMMAGLDMGIDLGAPAANDTLAAAVDPAPQVSQRATGSASVTHNTGGVTINITISGIGSVNELKEMMPEIMADALEQAGLMTGAPQAA